MKPSVLHLRARSTIEALESRVLLAAFVVTSLNVSGPGSLRDSILMATRSM